MSFTPRRLAQSVAPLARKNIGRDWDLYAALIDHWREIAGEDYATLVTPVKISFPRGGAQKTDGTLTLRAPQGAAMALSYRTPQLLERIATFLGTGAIVKIALDTHYTETPPAPPPQQAVDLPPDLHTQLAEIEDPDVRQALEELGKSIFSQTE
jgi:hypothetical protein